LSNTNTNDTKLRHDWHNADIKAALEKAGWSLSRLGLSAGLSRTSLKQVFNRPWPLAEQIIAHVIGVEPSEIWPTRYYEDSTPKRGQSVRHSDKWLSIKERLSTEQIQVNVCKTKF